MYTDISKIKKSDIKIPKGSKFYLLNDGRLIIYSYISLNIYNMVTFKVDLTINENTFPNEKEPGEMNWGELVCFTELKNGFLVLGFGRALDFTNLIIDIKDNKPNLIKKIQINNGDFCCRKLFNFHLGEKDFFIAGDCNPQIYEAENPFNEITTLDIVIVDMMQIKNTNLLAYIETNNFGIIDLTNIEEEKKPKKNLIISFDKNEIYFKLIQSKEEIICLGGNILRFINKKNYEHKSLILNKEFYSLDTFNAICLLYNEQLLAWNSNGSLFKIDINKKEILQKYDFGPKADVYFFQCLAYKDKYLIFSEEEKLYEIQYNEKEEVKNYIEEKPKKTIEDFMKEQDNIVKKIREEKNIKDEIGNCKPPYTFYYMYRYNSMKKEFPLINERNIFSLCLKEYNYLKPENQKFFENLSINDN